MGWDGIGLDWIGLDWIGLDWIGLNWIGLDYIRFDLIRLFISGQNIFTKIDDRKFDNTGIYDAVGLGKMR
jgi:hypothetical protein